jgi:hypothetical protein
MKRRIGLRIIAITMISVIGIHCFGQEDDDSGKLPVRAPFEAGLLIDNPTTVSPMKGGIELNIVHRFGPMDNGISDLFGLYAPSNIKMGINYGITDRIMLGLGTTKDYKLQDLNWKIALIRQNRNGSVPVSVSYFGNVVLDARSKENFGPVDRFRGMHRFSYFTQFIVARKFNEVISLQVAPSFMYYNAIDRGVKNYNIGVSAGGRAKIFSSSSIIFEYDQSFIKSEAIEAKPNMGLGYEIGTATHAFQIFVSTYNQIIPQRNMIFNTNDFTEGKFLFGFNITVRL